MPAPYTLQIETEGQALFLAVATAVAVSMLNDMDGDGTPSKNSRRAFVQLGGVRAANLISDDGIQAIVDKSRAVMASAGVPTIMHTPDDQVCTHCQRSNDTCCECGLSKSNTITGPVQ